MPSRVDSRQAGQLIPRQSCRARISRLDWSQMAQSVHGMATPQSIEVHHASKPHSDSA